MRAELTGVIDSPTVKMRLGLIGIEDLFDGNYIYEVICGILPSRIRLNNIALNVLYPMCE